MKTPWIAWRGAVVAWIRGLAFTMLAAALAWTVVAATMTSPVGVPAVKWGRVAAEHVVAAVRG